MNELQDTHTGSKPARRPNGYIFGSVQNGVLWFHVKSHSLSLQAIGVDARWLKKYAAGLRQIMARVDSLGGLYVVEIDIFKRHAFERTLRSDFGPQLFLTTKHWRKVRDFPSQLDLGLDTEKAA